MWLLARPTPRHPLPPHYNAIFNCMQGRSLSTGAPTDRKLSTMAVYSETPDGAQWQGESVAASTTSSTDSGRHIAAFLPSFRHLL